MVWYDTIVESIASAITSKINNLISSHNTSSNTHSDIRNSIPSDVNELSDEDGIIPTDTSDLTNGAGFLTSVPAHTNATASVVGQATSSVFGHAKAGASTPSAVTTGTASVGTDNGLYARADHSHKHPSYTSKSAGLYRITVNASGHVSAASAVSITYSDDGVFAITY